MKNSPREAFCRPCQKVISLSNMGVAAVDSHAKSKKHVQWKNGSSLKNEMHPTMLEFLSSSKKPSTSSLLNSVKDEKSAND